MATKKNIPKPFWQTNLFIVVFLIISNFFPIWLWTSGADILNNSFGFMISESTFIILALIWLASTLLMWRYATWKGPIKVLVTLPYATLITLLVFVTVKSYLFPEPPPPPSVINQSQYFGCKPINEQWGQCKSLANNISFEYPVNWYYVDDGISGIGFSPSEEKLKNGEGVVLTFEPLWGEQESTEAAKKSVRDYLSRKYPGLDYTEKEVNGFYIIDWSFRDSSDDALFVSTSIIADKMVYWIHGSHMKVTEEELYSIWNHMINSLKKEE